MGGKGQNHDITGFYFFRLSIQQPDYVIDITPTNAMLRYCRIAGLVPYRALLGFSPATQNPPTTVRTLTGMAISGRGTLGAIREGVPVLGPR